MEPSRFDYEQIRCLWETTEVPSAPLTIPLETAPLIAIIHQLKETLCQREERIDQLENQNCILMGRIQVLETKIAHHRMECDDSE